MGKTLYDFNYEFEELIDKALNDLSPKDFVNFLDNISVKLDDYKENDWNDKQRMS